MAKNYRILMLLLVWLIKYRTNGTGKSNYEALGRT